MEIVLGLGSNLGNCEENLKRAETYFWPKIRLIRSSRSHWTAPQYYEDQPQFLNKVVIAETGLSPEDLLNYLKSIEQKMGREPAVRYGPRIIDIDILYYGQSCVNLPGLVIPHPEIPYRSFVLSPLCEIVPYFICPLHKKTAQEMLHSLIQPTLENAKPSPALL